MKKDPAAFEIEFAPLTGVHLIEAGAGTGKTHAITGLYLRFLIEAEITLDRILVLTYTKAATAELTDRVRRRILDIRNSLAKDTENTPFIDHLIRVKKDPDRIITLCEAALADFDRSSIFTIHGFCLRVLQECAFETGYPFDTALSGDISEIVEEAAQDFWRREIVPLSPHVVKLIGIESPKTLVALLRGNRHVLRILPEPVPEARRACEVALAGLEQARQALCGLWAPNRPAIWHMLLCAPLNGKIYGTANCVAGGPKITQREKKIGEWIKLVDRFLADGNLNSNTQNALDKFSQSVLDDSTHKNQSPPKHPVFDRCEAARNATLAVDQAAKRLAVHLKTTFLTTIDTALKKKKAALNIQSYDDLLIRVHEALLDPEKGPRVKQLLSRQYPVALVDEFQDTDPVQYAIFRSLFGGPSSALFMIGDPKQAIYGFRGADLFSYMTASQNAGHHHTLTRNWRATPNLINAVNTVFDSIPRPFVFPSIDFIDATPAKPDDPGITPALTIRYIPNHDSKGFNKKKAGGFMTAAAVEEILRTLSQEFYEGKPVQPEDIAVLVRTNDQGARMKDALAEHGIASVLWSTESVFNTPEAEEVRRFMAAVADPGAMHYVKSAFITDLMGGQLSGIHRLDTDPMEAGRLTVKFDVYHRLLEKQGFLRMFRRFLREESASERILSLPGGERRLTNLLHLCELMHAAQMQRELGAAGLLRWLTRQMDRKPEDAESAQLRLESDTQSLKIITIHKSKGLEYPIVLCPFTWNGSEAKDGALLYHDPEQGNQLTLHLGQQPPAEAKGLANAELLAENLRLFYVALTRAKRRCWIGLTRVQKDETSAPAYLFHSDTGPDAALPLMVEALKDVVSNKKSDSDRIRDLKTLEMRSAGAIRVDCQEILFDRLNPAMDKGKEPRLECRHFTGKIDAGQRITSYSALAAARQEIDEPRDLDGNVLSGFQNYFSRTQPADNALSGFPRGTRAGTMIHGIFERIGFQDPDSSENQAIIRQDLKKYGLGEKWAPALSKMIREVLTTPLPVDGALRLQWLPKERRVHEMPFFYPIRPLTPQAMADLFRNAGQAGWVSDRIAATFEALSFLPTQGVLTGVMDLVFEWEDRFYLCDWKSNDLGPDPSDYREERILEEMALHRYHLQYGLYALALHRYLTQKLPTYDYETHFGGVMYLFIRGMSPESGSGYGIYFDRPKWELVREMERQWLISP